MSRRVLLVGWDAADWAIARPLVEAGRMPVLARMMRDGCHGNLATIQPALSPMLWTSIATGKRPFKHGIHGFTEVDPVTGAVRPVTSLSRRCRALWNLFQLRGRKSIVAGWWPSHPAEPISGAMVSNHFADAGESSPDDWAAPPGSVYPAALEARLQELRIHPQHLGAEHLLPFVPEAAAVDQSKDRRLYAIARMVAASSTLHAAATELMRRLDWSFAAVYFDAIDHFCHGFMDFHPPASPAADPEAARLYREVVGTAYVFHDMMLGTLLALAGEDTAVVLVSDHGFEKNARSDIPLAPGGPAAEHRTQGMFVACGAGIRRGGTVAGASILDVCPTILHLAGLPVGADMDGRPITSIMADDRPVETIASWEDESGADGSHPKDREPWSDPDGAALERLVALGYVEAPAADAVEAAKSARRDQRYHLALSLMDCGRYGEAEPILEALHREWPDESRFGVKLAACYHAIGRLEKVRPLVRRLVRHRLATAHSAARALRELPDDADPVAKAKLAAVAEPTRDALRHFLAFAAFSRRDHRSALRSLRQTSEAYRQRPATRRFEGEILLRQRRWQEAAEVFQDTLKDHPEEAFLWRGLARARLSQGRITAAEEAALRSLGLVFQQPLAHFLLGVARYRLGRFDEAIEAFKVALRQNPTYPAAHRFLAEIYQRHRDEPVKASAHLHLAAEARRRLRDFRKKVGRPVADEAPARRTTSRLPASGKPDPQAVTLVVGLPRAGTSMTMRMLEAAGVEPFTDGRRAADVWNPHGYFEAEATAALARDATWLPQAKGRALKASTCQ